jgi:hypothetical protein
MCNGMTACQVAMGNERWEVVELLRAKVAAWANPLLHYAARHGDLKRLQEALAGGADVNCIANDPRETPLMAAAGNGQAAAIRLLIAHGADPRKQAGRVPVLYLATVFGRNIEAIEVLLTAGAKTDADFDGVTPLMAAAKRGDLEVVKLLLTHGANPNARNRHRMLSVLDYAMEGKAKKCIELLRMSGATSCREESRSLAHMLAKEFGGKPVNGDGWKGVVTAHFSVRSVLTGFPCEFVVGPEGFIVRLERVRFKEPVFSGRRDSAFNFSATPSGQHPDYHEVPAATQEFGKPVFRRGKTSPTDQALIRFFRQNRAVLTELALTGEEQVEVWNDGVAIAILAADWSKARMRLEVIERFLAANCRPPETEQRLFAGEWLLKVAVKAEASSARQQLGGEFCVAVGCPLCGGKSHLMVELDLGDPALPVTKLGHRKLPVFWCLNCLEWDPMFFDLSGDTPLPLPAGGAATKSVEAQSREASLPARKAILVAAASGKNAGKRSKLGGGPIWVQSDETPDCPKCAKRMTFVLQVTSDARVSFGDTGLLYFYICADCLVSASLVQSH